MPMQKLAREPDGRNRRIRYLPRHAAGLHYTLATESDGKDEYHLGAEQDGRWNHVQECLLLLVAPGDTVLDIGANIGAVAVPLAARGTKVIAYEVLAENVRFLKAALRANRLEDRVTIRNVAVWESATPLSFTGSSAWARVVLGQRATHEAVAIDTDLPPAMKIAAVKLDVEGSEMHVLRGMRDLLESQHPHIVFESNSLELARLGSSATMMRDYLERFGYRIYRIHDRRRLLRAGTYPQESGVVDFLATRFNSWQLRWKAGFRVGSLRSRHIVNRIVEWGDDRWPDHLNLIAVADQLPTGVMRDQRVACLLDDWHERYRDHPLLETVRVGVLGPRIDDGEAIVSKERSRIK